MITLLTRPSLLPLGLGIGMGLVLGLAGWVRLRGLTREQARALERSSRELELQVGGRRRAEQARQSVEERFQAIFEGANDMILVHQMFPDGRRRFVEANGRACELLGYSREELLGMGPQDILVPERAAHVEERVDEVRSAGRRLFETCWITRAGNLLPVEVSSRHFLLDGVESVASCCRDLTLRRQAEERLRIIERRYRNIMERSSDGIVLVEPDFTPLDVNRRFLEIFGCSEAEAGRAASRLLEPGDLESVRDSARFFERGLEVGGVLLALEISAAPMSAGRLLLVVRDVTERRRLREESLRAAQLASLGELAAGVAHEINNPLNVIMSYADLLDDEIGAELENPVFLSEIRSQSRRISAIVASLLSLAKVQREERAEVAPGEVLRDALSLVRRQMEREGVRLDVGEAPDGLRVLARPGELQQVFVNVLSNARHAMNERFAGPHPDKVLRVEFSRRDDGGAGLLRTSFLDSGPGFGAESRARAFEPFFTTRPRNLGTGLGLSICHRIVREHGGRMLLEDAPGGGAAVHVDIPLTGGAA